jgi:hypothetical protein
LSDPLTWFFFLRVQQFNLPFKIDSGDKQNILTSSSSLNLKTGGCQSLAEGLNPILKQFFRIDFFQ